ncbi:MAG: DUF4249 domain-containing protein, partial [Lewinella sp.]|nr:DUF4249 domain-containing protein [Lewinella sp.]
MIKHIVIVVLALVLYSCVEPFEPEVGAYESTLVVDGLFTNSADTSSVILSRSYAYSERKGEAVQGATVVIEDDQGQMNEMKESSPGVYQNDPAAFSGEVGRSYRLRITTLDGQQFESSWELMKPAPPVGEIYFEYKERLQNEVGKPPIPGIQIYLDSDDPEQKTRYYRWEFEETYEFHLKHHPVIEVIFGSNPGFGGDRIEYVSPGPNGGFRCWKHETSTRIMIASSENLTEDAVVAFPINYVDITTYRLYRKYSLLVKQYAISKGYYDHLRKVLEVNETTGSLFDPIPNETLGNIHSSDGRDIPVLGYFSAAGVDTSRFFIDNTELPFDAR